FSLRAIWRRIGGSCQEGGPEKSTGKAGRQPEFGLGGSHISSPPPALLARCAQKAHPPTLGEGRGGAVPPNPIRLPPLAAGNTFCRSSKALGIRAVSHPSAPCWRFALPIKLGTIAPSGWAPLREGFMKKIALLLASALFPAVALAAGAPPGPDWAFMTPDPN